MWAAPSRGALPAFELAGIVGTIPQHVPIASAAVLPFLRFLIHGMVVVSGMERGC